uniref:Leucine zipper transcription factor-like protein 1 n=1 Tax=Macrostomum lignano TaxID=282301 RepID=A0A1I8IXM2_9PLAT
MSALGLNDHHQTNIVQYLRFARYQRGQRLKSVLGCFDDIRDSRLKDEANFTIDEVEDLLADLEENVRTEVEAELINGGEVAPPPVPDVSELENKALLDRIREFEEAEFSGAGADARPHLAPVNDTGSTELLRQEIGRLHVQIGQLEERLQDAQIEAERLKTDKLDLARQLAQGVKGGDRLVRDLEKELERMRDDRREMRAQHSGLGPDEAEDELSRVRALLSLAEQELELKVSQTAPFRNLKQMLQKKNDQIKDLRRRLAQFEDDEEDDD